MINIKADKDVKENAQRVAADLGLPLSTVVNAYLKEFIRERSVRFSVEPELRPRVKKELLQAIRDCEAGKNLSPAFSSAKEANAYLDAL